jgi:uncharacterized membrane protein
MSDDREFARLTPEHPQMLDRWLTRGAVALIVTLQFSLINDFGYGPRRIAPFVELILLIPTTALTIRAERRARLAQDRRQLESASSHRGVALVLGMTLVVVVSLANARSLLLLVQALLAGKTHNGRALLLDALNIWATNVIVFSLWYWALDRGGPWIDRRDHRGPSEFIFPYMTLPAGIVAADARPSYVDYLFLSFNTSTAFSPTDTLPLTARMKLLMILESIVSLGTLALVAARAVNILA